MFVYVIRHTDRKSYKYMQCPNVYQCVSQSIPGVVYIGTEKNLPQYKLSGSDNNIQDLLISLRLNDLINC